VLNFGDGSFDSAEDVTERHTIVGSICVTEYAASDVVNLQNIVQNYRVECVSNHLNYDHN
jgi:hypothetical protein